MRIEGLTASLALLGAPISALGRVNCLSGALFLLDTEKSRESLL